VTKSDSFLIPRINDCIDRIGSAKNVTQFDFLKGFWQVSLTDKAKDWHYMTFVAYGHSKIYKVDGSRNLMFN